MIVKSMPDLEHVLSILTIVMSSLPDWIWLDISMNGLIRIIGLISSQCDLQTLGRVDQRSEV
jgi:hypothetical protein